jgi:hypothetical protein
MKLFASSEGLEDKIRTLEKRYRIENKKDERSEEGEGESKFTFLYWQYQALTNIYSSKSQEDEEKEVTLDLEDD